jgi:MGT family glycosyltransferase
MSKFLVVTWDGAGNLMSTLGVARQLAQQGGDVRLLGHRSIHDRCGEHGWRFRPFGHTTELDSTARMAPDEEMPLLTRELWFSDSVARDVEDELQREPADVVLADAMLLGALCAGEGAAVPTVALFHTAFALFRGGPLVEMLSPALPAVNATRERLGLAPVEHIAEVHEACALNIVAGVREFEPEMPFPPNVRFVGPVLDGPPLTTRTEDLAIDDGPEPLVLVSLSTSYQAQEEVIQRLVDTLGELPVRAVVTTGPAIDPTTIRAAANTRIARFAPHDRLLPAASLVVTHGGLGTVMAALSHGVPLLCVPMGRDQFFNASRVAELGAGRVIDAGSDAPTMAAAIAEVLDDSKATAGAKDFARVIASYAGAREAAAELDALASAPPWQDRSPRARG